MSKAQVKLELDRMSLPDKVQFTRQVVTAMTGNANFTTPVPVLLAVTASANATETAFNVAKSARDTAITKTGLQNDAEKALDLLLTQLGNYVESTSKGDATIIKSAGMSVRDKSTPIGELPAPTDIGATAGDKEGEIDLSWNSVKGAKSYVIQMSVDTPTLWMQQAVSTKSKCAIENLVSGRRYWFRVAAVGSAGQGAYSEPAVKFAP